MTSVFSGSTPYPGMGAREVMRRVRDGYRLERPSHCHPDLYKIIAKCWAGDMNKRPDFSELRQVSTGLENITGLFKRIWSKVAIKHWLRKL